MNLDNITPEIITEKFSKWISRWICNVLREHAQTGQIVVNRINMQDRPKNIYEVKEFVVKLEALLPIEESASEAKWYFEFRRDLRRWRDISERLSAKEFLDVKLEDVVSYMIEDHGKLEELLDIVMMMDIE